VDEPRRSRRRAGGEVVTLDERDRQAAQRSISGDARSDDAAANDEEIDGPGGERPGRLIS
jgi:hypothetical protein